MANLSLDLARCKAERKCPSAGHCRRHLDQPLGAPGLYYAAWEVRRDGADRCDGFIPINDQSVSTTAQGGNP